MQNKWTFLTVLLILSVISIVPITAQQGQGAGFWMWFSPAITPEGLIIETLFNWVLALCGFLFIGVTTAMVYFCVAYREGVRDETPDTHGHLGIELTWTVIPTIIMVVLGIYSFDVYSKVIDSSKNALNVKVVAQQFAWKTKYPNSEITLSNEMVLPSNRPIQFHINSKDVLHSFYVPEFRMKQDAVPGMETRLNVEEITETGQYTIKCAELCGVGHYRMLADLTVVSPDEFKKWKSMPSSEDRREYIKKVIDDE